MLLQLFPLFSLRQICHARLWSSCSTTCPSPLHPPFPLYPPVPPLLRRSRWYLPVLKEPAAASTPSSVQDAPPRSLTLALRGALIHQSGSGLWSLLPLGQRVYDKIERTVDAHLTAIGCQKMSMPALQPPGPWKETGRWEGLGKEMFRLHDRKGSQLGLAPTHEECITQIVASLSPTRTQLPLMLYQVGRKFRDEPRPRGGLLRAREFVMKDLYSFDATVEGAKETYERVKAAYCDIFQSLGVQVLVAGASGGNIGGSLTHEFHVAAETGEDELRRCGHCEYCFNKELDAPLEEDASLLRCPQCGRGFACSSSSTVRGIEVGHTFLLGDRYSVPLKASLGGVPLQMGCYGLGLTRILAAAIEQSHDERGLRWPLGMAPFRLAVATLGPSSDTALASASEACCQRLSQLPGFGGEVLWDESQRGAGEKLAESELLGHPFTLVVGSSFKKTGRYELRLRLTGEVLTDLSLDQVEAVLLNNRPHQ